MYTSGKRRRPTQYRTGGADLPFYGNYVTSLSQQRDKDDVFLNVRNPAFTS